MFQPSRATTIQYARPARLMQNRDARENPRHKRGRRLESDFGERFEPFSSPRPLNPWRRDDSEHAIARADR